MLFSTGGERVTWLLNSLRSLIGEQNSLTSWGDNSLNETKKANDVLLSKIYVIAHQLNVVNTKGKLEVTIKALQFSKRLIFFCSLLTKSSKVNLRPQYVPRFLSMLPEVPPPVTLGITAGKRNSLFPFGPAIKCKRRGYTWNWMKFRRLKEAKVKSAFEPNGPSGRSLSRFL